MSSNLEDAAKLQAGETIKIRRTGNSMTGKINSGQLVTLEPVTDNSKLEVGDIVFCKVRGVFRLHLIGAKRGNQFQITNNHGFVNGWTSTIFGKAIAVED